MPERLLNYTGHQINILANADLCTPRYDIDPNLAEPARAAELPRLIGLISVGEFMVPVKSMAFGGAVNLPPPEEGVLGIASLDTLRAHYRDHGRIDGFAAPDDIVRTATGIHGARGLAVPYGEPTITNHPVMLAEDDVENLPPIDQWVNFGAYPMKLFPFDTPDVIDPSVVAPIVVAPVAEPIQVERRRYPNPRLTERFNVPIVHTTAKAAKVPNREANEVAWVQPEAPRILVKLGLPVRRMVVVGDLVRNPSGGIEGGRSVMVYSPDMLWSDPF